VSSAPVAPATPRVFRLPRSAYLIAVSLLFCAVPLAFAGDGSYGARPVYGPRILFLLVPIAAALYIGRTATVVDRAGIRVRAVLGSRRLRWDELRGLSVAGSNVYAVAADGSVRLPCVHVADLAAVSRASEGRLPPVEPPTPKFAPARRRRR
jgi:hypothetical protein